MPAPRRCTASPTASATHAPSTVTAQWSCLLDRMKQVADKVAPSAATPAVGRAPAAANSGTGLPETSRFGASSTKPDSATAATATITNTNSTWLWTPTERRNAGRGPAQLGWVGPAGKVL